MTEKELHAEALRYHSQNGAGKLEICPTKPVNTPEDLSLAYSPGVAAPSLAIAVDPERVYDYTRRGNLVGVISNGSAVLGLGNIGALAAKPVMEGKCVLFKTMAGIDAFDIEIDAQDPDTFVECVQHIAPTFGGINLEDIKAPECFEIERRLIESLDIPVMHDDQHGTAIIVTAALINAAVCIGKEMSSMRIVINGAGAAAIASARMLRRSGIPAEKHCLVRQPWGSRYLARRSYSQETRIRDLATVGRSRPSRRRRRCVSRGVESGPAHRADGTHDGRTSRNSRAGESRPEITRDEALAARPDAIYASGRSDVPNQVNNLLGFPYIFRGALDSRAGTIMKI